MSSSGLLMSKREFTEEQISSRQKFGNFETDPENYYELINTVGFGIYNFLAININGLTYFRKDDVEYDQSTGDIKVKRLEIKDDDEVTAIFNRMHSNGRNIGTKSLPVSMIADEESSFGNYEEDPENYREEYDISNLVPYNVIGINIDSVFYVHKNKLKYDRDSRKLTLKGLKLDQNSHITLIYNRQQN